MWHPKIDCVDDICKTPYLFKYSRKQIISNISEGFCVFWNGCRIFNNLSNSGIVEIMWGSTCRQTSTIVSTCWMDLTSVLYPLSLIFTSFFLTLLLKPPKWRLNVMTKPSPLPPPRSKMQVLETSCFQQRSQSAPKHRFDRFGMNLNGIY